MPERRKRVGPIAGIVLFGIAMRPDRLRDPGRRPRRRQEPARARGRHADRLCSAWPASHRALVSGLAKLVGFPARSLGGPAGQLASSNAVRNPARTASTAAALMIGLALVSFVAVLGKGLHGSSTGRCTSRSAPTG